MNQKIYKYFWIAKIVAWLSSQSVLNIIIDEKSFGFIVAPRGFVND